MVDVQQDVDVAFEQKRRFFDEGNTRSYRFRVEQLIKLRDAIKGAESQIVDALRKDMHKPEFESYTSEIAILYEEISYTIKHLKRWMRSRRVSTPLVLHPSSSRVVFEPLGVVLIVGPWNYPFQLLFAPLIGAIAAGNCAILKPSDNTKHTARLVEKLVSETFDPNYVSVVVGPGAMVGPMLIERYRFDHIFFTGSPNVGKQIMAMAAKHLTPVTLELGGKSPAIVDKHVNIKVAAKRLVAGKFFNAGQTCVAPDYLLVHEQVKDLFVDELKSCIAEFYGSCDNGNESLTHIVNQRRFDTLVGYLAQGRIVYGGRANRELCFIEPTIIDNVSFNDSIMQEEIFGPILPVLTFSSKEEVVQLVRRNRYPLACYIFSNDSAFQDYLVGSIEFGGGAVNNALLHLANPELPFGGVGNSGMGSYHGKRSFEVMSHAKSILSTSTWLDFPIRYPSYTDWKLKLVKLLMG